MILDYKINKKLSVIGDQLCKSVVAYLKQFTEISITTKRMTDIKRCCYCIILNAAHSINKGVPYIGPTLDANNYSNPAIYNGNNTGRKISYRNMQIVLTYLENFTNTIIERGGVTDWEFVAGGRDSKGKTVWKQIPKSFKSSKMQLDEGILSAVAGVSLNTPPKESVIEVRDSSGKPIGIRLTEKEKQLVGMLNSFNSALDKNKINIQENRFYISVKKVYNNSSLKEGGRVFMSGVNVSELLSKNNRREIYINDIRTVEIDYAQLWPRIAADLSGQQLDKDFDVYGINIEGYCPSLLRDLSKIGLMCLFNADNFEMAYYATLSEMKSSGMRARIDEAQAKGAWSELPVVRRMLEMLMDRNAYLLDYFFSKKATFLMNIESSMMDYIMERAVEDDRILVPIYDSVVVQEDYADIAESNMYKAYDVVVGGYNCVVRRK